MEIYQDEVEKVYAVLIKLNDLNSVALLDGELKLSNDNGDYYVTFHINWNNETWVAEFNEG